MTSCFLLPLPFSCQPSSLSSFFDAGVIFTPSVGTKVELLLLLLRLLERLAGSKDAILTKYDHGRVIVSCTSIEIICSTLCDITCDVAKLAYYLGVPLLKLTNRNVRFKDLYVSNILDSVFQNTSDVCEHTLHTCFAWQLGSKNFRFWLHTPVGMGHR